MMSWQRGSVVHVRRFAPPTLEPDVHAEVRRASMTRNQFLIIALACSLTGACNRDHRNQAANAPNPDTGTVGTAGTADKNKPGIGDKDFVEDVAKANTAEIELGRMASERGANGQVKKFAQMMVDDHTQAGDKLKAIATDKDLERQEQIARRVRRQGD